MHRQLQKLLLAAMLPTSLAAQSTAPLVDYATQRATLDRRGMLVLGSWAMTNVGVSGARYFPTEGSEKYFHQMNVGWGVVNLALAGTTFLAARRSAPEASRTELVRTQFCTENLYLFNAGLDVAYVATGFYLRERARSRPTIRRRDQLKGYGQSLLLQGGFLLAFDGIMFAAQHRHGQRNLYPLLSHVQIGPTTVALTLPLR